jgi:solute carrier family 12 (sodium/potassium/chloride transporter), member 2
MMPAMTDDSDSALPSGPPPAASEPSSPASEPAPPAAEAASPELPPEDAEPRGAGLGTFQGVFTPSILTILGVIMYLRFGWVVGNVGLVLTLVIVVTCTAVTFVTGLSMASIATDRRVRAGGAYFMISRSLGLETGGAVGIPLYFALALSMALYVIGFAEIVGDIFPRLDPRWVGVVTALAVAGLAVHSASLALRSQYIVMAVIGLSLLSFFLGGPVEAVPADAAAAEPLEPSLRTIPVGFWVAFAVFFPAVTGIEAGVNMSGDLKNPARSIPLGTFAALGVGFLVYATMPFFFAAWADSQTLIEDPFIMRRMAWWGPLILLGAMGATLSSAMGSILGAPRVLQALARDEVVPRPLRFLGHGSGEDDAPKVGTVVTLAIALVAVYFADLNMVAPVLTMFFLTSYMTVNFAAGIEGFLQSPSFRPAFRIKWPVPMAGAVGCLLIMFLINAPATIVAASVVLGIFVWLQRRGLRGTWGDVRSGMWLALVRMGLLRIGERGDARNWRPHPLVLSGEPTRRWELIEFANAITHDRGLVTIASSLPESEADSGRQAEVEAQIQKYLKSRGVEAFVRLVTAPEPFTGAKRLVEVYGFGRLVPNTVILGTSEGPLLRDDRDLPPEEAERRDHPGPLAHGLRRAESHRRLVGRPSGERRPHAGARLPPPDERALAGRRGAPQARREDAGGRHRGQARDGGAPRAPEDRGGQAPRSRGRGPPLLGHPQDLVGRRRHRLSRDGRARQHRELPGVLRPPPGHVRGAPAHGVRSGGGDAGVRRGAGGEGLKGVEGG